MHVRQLMAIATLTLVAACGGSSDAPADKPGKAETPTKAEPTAQTPGQALDASICGQVDGAEVAAALGQKKVFDKEAGSALLGIPSFETCSVAVGVKDSGSAITFGWSVDKVSAADWDAIVKHEKDTNGRYTKIQDIEVGDAGYFREPAVAVALVGDRVIRASYAGGPTSAATMAKVLKLAVPIVPDLEIAPAGRALPECSAADAEAEVVLGAKATIRRDRLGEKHKPQCGWATPTAAVTVSSGAAIEGETIKDRIDMYGGEAVSGIGKAAGYFGGEDGLTLTFDPGDGSNVTVGVPPLLPGDKASLIALAKKIAGNY